MCPTALHPVQCTHCTLYAHYTILRYTTPNILTLQVLGLGTKYVDYMSKTDAYLNYLKNSTGPHTRTSASGGYDISTTYNTSDYTLYTTHNHTMNTANSNTNNTTHTTSAPVPEDDVVLFFDAYDVLVFPSIVNAAAVLAQSRSPLLFCAERGVYPEYAGWCSVE